MIPKLISITVFCLLGGGAGGVAAEEDLRSVINALQSQISELKHQAEQSNARIADLEKQLTHTKPIQSNTAPPPALPVNTPRKEDSKPAVTLGDTKDTFKIPGTETSIAVGGFVKLDAIYNSVSAGSNKLGNQFLVPSQIPVGKVREFENSQFIFNPKETRFWVKSFTPSKWGDINAFMEIDFYGSADTYNYTPRLRHAYGSMGHLLAGHTWTTFLNVLVIPDTLDFGGPVGAVFYGRQPQLRWTQPFTLAGMPWELQIAAESSRSRLWEAPQNQPTPDGFGFVHSDDERYPDIIARVNLTPDWGNFSLLGMARQIRNASLPGGRTQELWGGAVSLAGKFQTFDLDNIRFMLSYGDVLGRYASINTFEDAVLDASGRLHLLDIYAAMFSYQHWWNSTWRSTLAYGFEGADQPEFVSGGITRLAHSVHVNLLWSPVLQTTFGLEYIYATRELVDGNSGDLSRIQFSTRFNF